jgi:hypothetical protein
MKRVLIGRLLTIANCIATGKDFFVDLRKQVTTLQQGGTVAGG